MGKTCMFSDGKKEESYKFYQFIKMKIVKVLLSRHLPGYKISSIELSN